MIANVPLFIFRHVIRSAVLFGLLLLLLCGEAKSAPSTITASEVEALTPRIEQYVAEAMNQWMTPGMAVGIIAGDRLVYAKGFGVRQLGGTEKVDETTVFEIGSTSKAFVAATLAIQVDQGHYAWDDRVIDHDASFRLADPWVTREFRIFDLLAQRSGLPAMALTDMAFYGYDAAAIRRGLRYIEPVSSFRARFGYQNAFHLVAGHIVETASKQPSWNSFAQQQLFAPLGMNATTGSLDEVRKQKNLASGHYYDDAVKVMPRSAFPYNVVPAGGLNSNIRDMAQWVRLQINEGEIDGERIISARNLLETRAPRILVTDMGAYSPEDTVSYANGWMIHNLPEGRLVEHGGSTGGFTAYVGFDPDRRVGVVVLANMAYLIGPGSAHGVGAHILRLFQTPDASDYAGKQMEAVRRELDSIKARALPVLKVDTTAYQGIYESPVMGRVELKADADGVLSFTLGPKAAPVRLLPLGPRLFKAEVELPADDGSPMVLSGEALFTSDRGDRPVSFQLDTMDSAGQPPFSRVE